MHTVFCQFSLIPLFYVDSYLSLTCTCHLPRPLPSLHYPGRDRFATPSTNPRIQAVREALATALGVTDPALVNFVRINDVVRAMVRGATEYSLLHRY